MLTTEGREGEACYRLLHVSHPADCYEIGSIHFDIRSRSLISGGRPQKLPPLCYGVLKILCENMGHFIPRSDIIKAVWNEKNWELKERSLHNTLSQLRAMLSDDRNICIEAKAKAGVCLQKLKP